MRSCTRYCNGQFIRVAVPDYIVLRRDGGYQTTECELTLNGLGYDCYILYNGKWRKFNWLKQIEPYEWHNALEYIFGLYNCYDTVGWTDYETYAKRRKERMSGKQEFTGISKLKYPRFKEDKKGLKLEYNVKEGGRPMSVDINGGTGEQWYKIYCKLLKKNEGNIV
jgi:hypothetical protein